MYLFPFSGEFEPVKISNVEKAFHNKASSKRENVFFTKLTKDERRKILKKTLFGRLK
jgi:hypothetical protein